MTSDSTIERQRFLLFGLLQKCPLNQNGLIECPLADLRGTLSLEEKLEYAEDLDVVALQKLMTAHDECFSKECQKFPPRQ